MSHHLANLLFLSEFLPASGLDPAVASQDIEVPPLLSWFSVTVQSNPTPSPLTFRRGESTEWQDVPKTI